MILQASVSLSFQTNKVGLKLADEAHRGVVVLETPEGMPANIAGAVNTSLFL